MELVVIMGRKAVNISVEEAKTVIYGYAAGLDMTRRDLQIASRDKGRPWSLGKNFEQSAVISNIQKQRIFGEITNQKIQLKVNGVIKQESDLSQMIWKAPEIISHLSGYYHLDVGDIIYTGTPAGVGPVQKGDSLQGYIQGLAPISLKII